MHTSSDTGIRKVFQGVAGRREMMRMFDRHCQSPDHAARASGRLHDGEWFEISEQDHDYMFNLLPPLWMTGDMFALRECLAGSVTSVFFTLGIDGRFRWFHGYCDLSDAGSPARMRGAIVARESWPVKAMTRAEKLDHIWSATHDDYRGYAGTGWREQDRGKRTVMYYGGQRGSVLALLDGLSDAQVAAKLPVQLRHLPDAIAA